MTRTIMSTMPNGKSRISKQYSPKRSGPWCGKQTPNPSAQYWSSRDLEDSVSLFILRLLLENPERDILIHPHLHLVSKECRKGSFSSQSFYTPDMAMCIFSSIPSFPANQRLADCQLKYVPYLEDVGLRGDN